MIVCFYNDNFLVKILAVFIRVSIPSSTEDDIDPFLCAFNLGCRSPPSNQFKTKNFKLIGGIHNGKNA